MPNQAAALRVDRPSEIAKITRERRSVPKLCDIIISLRSSKKAIIKSKNWESPKQLRINSDLVMFGVMLMQT